PKQLNQEIPEAISAIVMKLMAKTAEDRYQSDRGLKADLEECLKQWQTSREIKNFIPGQLDRAGRFLIPQKLYGRDSEVATLLAAFDRVSEGARELMLVSGYSGIGKTCVVQEVHKPITRQRGYFVSGKFDQFKRDIPYSSIIQAFQELVRQILTEATEKIKDWKQKLLETLGTNGCIITDVIPEVEMIIGIQPEVPKLGSLESQNRFNQVFQQFVRVFTTREHPLVVFLDDLQWADTASLKLLELLITDSDSQYLLILGAYRDNEVSPSHPTIITINEIQKLGIVVNNIVLEPLELNYVRQLVSETLTNTNNSQELADLLYQKTQGNPFFLTQLFKTLYTEQLLEFNFDRENWQWSIEKIQGFGVTDLNVVDLVSRNIQKLPDRVQRVLKLAACIGNRFYLEVLAIVNEKSLVETADDLWQALQAGLILPLSKNYKIPLSFSESDRNGSLATDTNRITYRFLHDRVQQAAYSLIPETEKQETHLKIGQLLLERTNQTTLEENIFDIVNQLNIGSQLISLASEKEELAKLNLMAGKKAKIANAYEAANKYLSESLKLLPEDAWTKHYELTRDLHIETVEVDYITGNIDRANSLSQIIFSNTQTLLEQIKIHQFKITFYYAQNKLQEMIDLSLKILKQLGVSLPSKPNQINVLISLFRTKIHLGRKKVSDLSTLPEMTEIHKKESLRILMGVIPATFNASPLLFPLVVFKMLNLSIKYGNSPLSAFGYACYGIILCSVLGDIERGYQFGQLAMGLLDRFDSKEMKVKIYFIFNTFIKHWKEHIKSTTPSLIEGYKAGLETGDMDTVFQCAANYSIHLNFQGSHLESVLKEQLSYCESANKYHQFLHKQIIEIFVHFTLSLTDSQNHLQEKENLENTLQLRSTESKNLSELALINFAQSVLSYLFKDYNRALVVSELTEQYSQNISGNVPFSLHHCYHSLILLASFHTTSKRKQKQYLKKVNNNQKKLKKWAYHAPMNFQHKYDLVEAEKCRILGKYNEASLLYDRAIAGAKTNKYTHEEALANELAAEFYNTQGRKNIAKTYMTEAYYSYIRWGAKAKVKDLDQRYPDLIARSAQESTLDSQVTATTTETSITATYGTTTHSTTGLASQVLDLNTVFKASLALSGELVVENLLEKLLKISIENAGASSGLFLTKPKTEWIIEAKGEIDPNQPQETEENRVSVEVVSSSRHSFPISLLNYVEQTKKSLVLDDASTGGLFSKDAYIQEHQPKSILCTPLIHQNKLTGILYLENNETSGAFTQDRLKVINLLASQISISVDNARLYTQLEEYSRTLESKVEERTQQLSEKNDQLKVTLKELKAAQKQIVAQEKLASLGSLTAGIAHEIRNPLNFVNSLANLSQDLTQDIAEEIDRQAEQLEPEAVAFINESLDYLKRNVSEIHQQGKRADSIITSMLMHARTGSSTRQPGNINFVIAEAVQLAHQSLRAKDASFNVELNTEYDDSIGQIFLAAPDLGRALINIVDNACYAARKKFKANPDGEFIPTVTVTTTNRDSEIEIRIRDNGEGIAPEIKEKIFNPFFTTKP
ncbi:AAA family ATPase, partial [Spirulina sp. 06S082]|uniref:trifunctional serine/threonine-protein kinase/ATP-binding protein/sensor histidine kinase n=1 Tax=Spirulina sp. 06S082 TaxID=3110248 RepID=UPI002B21177F